MPTQRVTSIPAVYLLLERNNQVLLSLRQGIGYRDGQWSLPAGHLEAEEGPIKSMVREAEEEINVTLDPAQMTLAHTLWRPSPGEVSGGRFDLFFRAPSWNGEPSNAEPHKCGGLKWVSLQELPSNTVPEVLQAAKYVLQGIPYSELTD